MAYPSDPEPNDVQITSTRYAVDSLKAEDQTVHTRLKKDKCLHEWRLSYQARKTTDITTLDAYFENQRGYYQSDTWTHPHTSATYTVRIKNWSKTRSIGTAVFDYAVDLEEQP